MVYVWAILAFAGLLVGLSAFLTIAQRVLINYGICTVDINAGERTFETEGGQTLLSSLYGEEIFIPSACGGRGSCGFCKISVLAGGGPILPTETPYVTRKEIRAGVRLACQVKVREDLNIRMPEELLNVRLFAAVVESTQSVTHDTKELRLSLIEPAEIVQRAGQYIQIHAPSPEGPVFRAYSISCPEYERHVVELVVRLVPGGIGSTYLHNLKVNDQVTLTGPFGEFRLNEDPDVELVCVAGGAGMAPVKNILFSAYRRWPERSAWLFFGCRTTTDVFYLEQFQELAQKHPNLHVVYALSDPVDPGDTWDGERGFIHISVDKHLKPAVRRQAFLCGPPPMIDAVTAVLEEKGLRPDNIFYDKF